MSGMINAAAPVNGTRPANGVARPVNGTPSPGLADSKVPGLKTPILAAAERQLESQLAPEVAPNYLKIVVAGMHAGLSPTAGRVELVATLKNSSDPVRDAARGAVGLVVVLRREAKGVMPPKAMIPAALTLMLHALDFVAMSRLATVDQPALVRATHIFTNEIFKHFGITVPMLHQAAARVQAITQSPQAMQAINLKAGIVKHPAALEPTPMPAA